jgi:DNA-binding response OmpR family regulator
MEPTGFSSLKKENRKMAGAVNTLVVDDEASIRFFLEEALQQVGHKVVAAASGEEALDRLREASYDLIILDLMLGGRVDGIRVLESVKWRWPETVVVILTAHGSLDSALAAIREGVDGYLLKPAEPEDLWQTVEAALERRTRLVRPRTVEEQEHILQHGPFTVDLDKQLVTKNGEVLELTSSEFDLLAHLVKNAYRAIPPQELVRIVRRYESEDLYESRQIIKWYVHRLRQKVESDPSNPVHIITARGVGYRFVS